MSANKNDLPKIVLAGILLGGVVFLGTNMSKKEKNRFSFSGIIPTIKDKNEIVYDTIKFNSNGTIDNIRFTAKINETIDVESTHLFLKILNKNEPLVELVVVPGNVMLDYENVNKYVEKGDILELVLISKTNGNIIQLTDVRIDVAYKT